MQPSFTQPRSIVAFTIYAMTCRFATLKTLYLCSNLYFRSTSKVIFVINIPNLGLRLSFLLYESRFIAVLSYIYK